MTNIIVKTENHGILGKTVVIRNFIAGRPEHYGKITKINKLTVTVTSATLPGKKSTFYKPNRLGRCHGYHHNSTMVILDYNKHT